MDDSERIFGDVCFWSLEGQKVTILEMNQVNWILGFHQIQDSFTKSMDFFRPSTIVWKKHVFFRCFFHKIVA